MKFTKKKFMLLYIVKKSLFCQYFYGMHMKKSNTVVAPDDNKFWSSAEICSNETGKSSFLLIQPTVTTYSESTWVPYTIFFHIKNTEFCKQNAFKRFVR